MATATDGPSTWNWPKRASPSVAKAATIASAAEATTGLTWSAAFAAASRPLSPSRSRSRKRNVMNRK